MTFSCPGIDVAEWTQQNRCPLFPGLMNRWLLIRTDEDAPTRWDIKQSLYDALVRWQGMAVDIYWDLGTAGRIGDFDNLRIVNTASRQYQLPNPAVRREQLQGALPTVTGKNHIWVELEFAYRGALTNIAWPVARNSLFSFTEDQCPTGADWVLATVGMPTVEAPPELDFAQKVAQVSSSAASAAGSALFWPLVGVGVVVGGALLAKRQLDK